MIAFGIALQLYAGLRPSCVTNMRQPDSPVSPVRCFRISRIGTAISSMEIDLTHEYVLRSDGVSVGRIKKERNIDLLPNNFTVSSGRKVWWKCKNCGQHWQASVANRVKGSGCPYDTGRLAILGKTDLTTQYPNLAAEWDYEKNGEFGPENFSAKSKKKKWWKCKNCGRSWYATIRNRTNGSRCPHCK